MEWRQQSSVSSAEAFTEARRWIEEVTEKSFMCSDFRAALDNGVLLCDLINRLKPGIIKKVNRLSTPIAGLDNVNLFLKACGKLGLNESQLFHPGDLQDLSSRVTLRHDESHRRLKNVLITIYWLGRKAHLDSSYSGPQLNLRAFEGLLGLALSKSLNEGSNILVKGEEYRLSWHPRQYMGQNSVDTELLDSNGPGINNEGCGSDAEAEQVFRVESSKSSPPSNNGYFLLSHHRKQGQVVNGRDRSSPITRLYKNPVRPERPVQVNPGWIWSKSLSDIPMVYSVKKCPQDNGVHDVDRDCDSAGDWNKENTQMSRVSVKDGEVLWQDHLTKWKNRRRSTKSDHERKSQDREHVISQMTNRVMPNFEKSEAQGKELPQREQVSSCRDNPGPLSSRQCPPTSGLRPHTVALLSRSYTSKAALCPTSSHPPLGPSLGPTPVSDGLLSGKEATVSSSSLHPTAVGAVTGTVSSGGVVLEQGEEKGTVEQATGVHKYLSSTLSWSGSASLPRGFRRSEGSSRPSSTVTTKPYGTRPSRVTSLPRMYNVDYSHGVLLNCEKEDPLPKSTRSSLTRQTAATNLCSQASLREERDEETKQKATEQMEEERGDAGLSSQTSFSANGIRHHQPYNHNQPSPQFYANQKSQQKKSSTLPSSKVDHSNMRVSISLRPSSRPDFGLQTHWDSTGLRVTSIQPGSPAELCQLCADDEIVTVDGVAVSLMNNRQWEEKMSSALQTGNLIMDIRRYGNTDWSGTDDGHHIKPGQHRVTLNLTRAPVLMGHLVNGSVNRSGQKDNIMPDKDNNAVVADGHKTYTRSEGGSSSAISDLQVPSLSPSSSSWSWDREEDRRRQEKWQEEQERLLQEQYQRDQERLEAEWKQAQQDANVGCRPTSGSQQTSRPVIDQVNTLTHRQGKVPSADIKELKQVGPTVDGRRQEVQSVTEQRWAADSYGFTQLSPAHRAKSLSTPALADCHRQIKGEQWRRKGQSLSKAEKERQQILEEMKKRTQLLTDNSWIRQRSSSFYKEPICVGSPLKRYESLDDLDSLHQSTSSVATGGSPRPHSAAAGYCAPTRNSSSRYSTGGILCRKNLSMDSTHFSSVRTVSSVSEELRLKSRLEPTAGGTTVNAAVSGSNMLMPVTQERLQITE